MMKKLAKRKISKKILKRVIKRPNPSNLKWKLDDYIRTQKITPSNTKYPAKEKALLEEIQEYIDWFRLDLDDGGYHKNQLLEELKFKVYHYKNLIKILEAAK